MKETTIELKTYKVRATCECGGEFLPTGIVLMTNPCQYPHKCNSCGKEETFLVQYPKIEYKE